eukprot:TRINITY_DN38050_c0_g2_i1.p1 TRINITY_DN38050_c0_g2~~TRINITY_DN38050_c0_g2_i1.p1  ORF type:complete len:118 (-),score=18.28 TRINITY_DN38050_c0_g2_i1:411-764(-)
MTGSAMENLPTLLSQSLRPESPTSPKVVVDLDLWASCKCCDANDSRSVTNETPSPIPTSGLLERRNSTRDSKRLTVRTTWTEAEKANSLQKQPHASTSIVSATGAPPPKTPRGRHYA